MNKKIIFGLLAISALVTGCKKEPYVVKSVLKVDQTLTVKNDNSQLVNLNAGDYPSDLNINSGRVKVTVMTARNEKTTFRLKLPQNLKFPTNGSFLLTSAQSGQPFETQVKVNTQIVDGPLRRDYQSCIIQDYIYDDCHLRGHNRRGRYCDSFSHTRWGQRLVEFYTRTYNRQFLAILSTQEQKVAAQIQGSRADHEVVYTYAGWCY